MCGRFTLTAPDDQIQDLFDVRSVPDREPHYNIAPTEDVVGVRRSESGEGESGREAVLFRWGLIPFWADDKSIGNRMINARSETVHSKNAFRKAFETRRCLIAADGFYEWKAVNGAKQPYYCILEDHALFAFAGLWESWTDDETGEHVESCTILTTGPNELVASVHDRMPVILSPDEYDLWLDTDAGHADVRDILEPYPADGMEMYPVSKRVNKPQNDDPQIIEPVEEVEETNDPQQSLL